MKIKKAFTLIELMISISIIVILTMTSYAPYSYYKNKASLKMTTREVSQLLYDSRNMAVNGAIGSLGNVSIGVYFDTSLSSNNVIKVFAYPYDMDRTSISNTQGSGVELIRTLTLKKGVELDDIDGNSNILFFFNSIDGDLTYYTWSGLTRNIVTDDRLSINFSFNGSNSPNLNKNINYYTNTNIIDY